MKFREVFRYEVEYFLRSPSTWIYAAVLLGLPFLLGATGGPGTAGVHRNAPVQVATISLALSLFFGMAVSAAIFGDAAVRDVQAGMDPLLFTSPQRELDYLGGRFLGALAINAAVLLALPVGLALGIDVVQALRGYPGPGTFGPFRLGSYAQPYFVILLPNAVLAGALLFTTGVLTRQIIPVYLAAAGLLITNMVFIGGLGEALPSLLGPVGFHALIEITQYWTTAERNTRLIGFPAALMWNRVLWLAVAAAALALLHRTFRFAHHDGGGRRARAARRTVETESASARLVDVPRVSGSFGFRTSVRQSLAVTGRCLADVAVSRWFAAVLLFLTGFTLLTGWNVGDSVFDSSTWPATLLVAETAIGMRMSPFPFLVIALYAGELVWKEREVGGAEIADVAPVPEGIELLGRFVALVAIILMIEAACMAGGLLIQALQGYYRFELGLYLRILFGLKLADHILFAVLAMAIHVVVNHKYLGHFVALLAFVGARGAPIAGFVRHNLLLYGGDPGWTYSDMNGFGPFIGPLVWFKLYWAAWALLLAVVAAMFRVRGYAQGLRNRFVVAGARFSGSLRHAAGVALALIVGLGGFIFYNTNILNAYPSAEERGRPQAEYETRYGKYEDVPQPTIKRAELRIEVYPEQQAVDLRGTYRLVNATGAAIDAVHVYLVEGIEARALSFDRTYEPVLEDKDAGYRIFALKPALAPGGSLSLSFDVAFRPRGFQNSGNQTDVAGNGAYFNRTWLPFIGYQPMFELTDAQARQRFGLRPRTPIYGPPDADASQARRDSNVDMDTIVGTAPDQIAIATGLLRRTWMENGRRYFHYHTEAPAAFGGTVFSARYAVHEDKWQDPAVASGPAVALQIFHHPAHLYTLDSAMRSMKASLDYFAREFGRYRDRQLRLVEIPRYGRFGRAHPHTIAFTEDIFLSRVEERAIDGPFYGIAHEIAHQWWGGMVRTVPAAVNRRQVRGASFLSESLANYSAMMVTEQTFGRAVARRIYDFQMERYLLGRASQSREVPLLDVEDQPYIAYRKGAIAMYMLRDQIGEERVSAALRRYFQTYGHAGPPYPSSRDLYAELRAVTPESHHGLLTDLFETITLWDVRAKQASVAKADAGYRVTLEVEAKKLRADADGNETEVPMDDLIEIGVFAQDDGEPLYLQPHRLHSGTQTIDITVPREPARAGVDPYHKLIDRQGADNVVSTRW